MEAGLRRTRDEIERKLKPGLSRIRVVDIVDAALKKVHSKLPPDPEYKTSALVVIRTSDGVNTLYENSGGLDVLSTVDHPCQCVGYASSLGWYFASSLFRLGMSLKWAKIVAAHIIKKCKNHSEYCGGETHLIEIPTTGNVTFIEDQSQIDIYEHYFAELDSAMRLVLPDGRADDVAAKQRLEVLNEVIKREREGLFLNLAVPYEEIAVSESVSAELSKMPEIAPESKE